MTTPNFNLAWATPIMRVPTETEALASRLTEYLLKCEVDGFKKPDSPQRPHDGVFESKFDFLTWPDERVEEFRNLLYGYLSVFVKSVNNFDDAQMAKLKFDNDCWFHITRDGGHFQPHNHPNASWSTIYCVDPGDAKNESSAGHVMFTDPRQTNSFLDPTNRGMRREVSFNALRFKLKPAELLIFPSYLYHYVEPYMGTRPRITIAANFWFATI